MIIIKKYTNNFKNIWDQFVKNNTFSTIYHLRIFLDYHPINRFSDNSILIYDNDILICTLPCCKKDDKYFSYSGSTYGGPVIHNNWTTIDKMKIIIDKIFEYYENKIEFRLANDIYFSEEIKLLYFLLSQKLNIKPELSWYIKSNDEFINKINNKRNKKNLEKMIKNDNIKCFITTNNNDYTQFYNILKINLNKNHNTNPTHTLEEFLHIKERIKDYIYLFIVKEQEQILGGVFTIKVTDKCLYTFYITKNIEYNTCAVIYAMYTISLFAKENDIKYVDYGISTENYGKDINIGLSDYKQNTLGGLASSRYLFLI